MTLGALGPDLTGLTPAQLSFLQWQIDWTDNARPNQLPPSDQWTECGYLAGRGFGKTRVGAEWIGRAAYEDPSGYDSFIISPTKKDTRFVCIEGESGLLSCVPPDLVLKYNMSDHIVTLRNIAGGTSVIRGFSAEEPERLRGPQSTRIWADELAVWQYADETWDMAMFGLRLGFWPQVLWTTTPRPKPIIKRLTQDQPRRVIVKGTTYDNRENLSQIFYDNVARYEGTKIGRQELHGELIDPEEAGIVKRSWFQLWPAKRALPAFEWIILSLDTAFTEKTIDKKTHDPDPTACGVWGTFALKGKTYIMLLDAWEEHLGMPELIKRVKREMKVAYGQDEDRALIEPLIGGAKPMTSGRKPDMCLIEDKGSGISLRQMLDREGITGYAYNPGSADKLARLHMVSHIFAQRRVFLPESEKEPGKPRTWCEPVIEQLCTFVGEGSVRHDDHVDQTTQAFRVAIDKNLLREPVKKADADAPKPPDTPRTNPYGQ